jgi:hypothetical protein
LIGWNKLSYKLKFHAGSGYKGGFEKRVGTTMAAESSGSDSKVDLGPSSYKNAAEYAAERLKDGDGTLRPCQLAEEYDCTNSHMRRALMELKRDGRAERVAHGEYTSPEDGKNTDADADESVFSAFSTLRDERPSGGGPVQSEDLDGGAGDQGGGDSMPTADELERQRELAGDSEGGDDDRADRADRDDDQDDDVDGPGDSTGGSDGDGPGGAGGGIPIPVSSWALVGGAVALVLLLMVVRGSSDGGGSADEEEDQDIDELLESSGGLVDMSEAM